jgi:hypothetical protein
MQDRDAIRRRGKQKLVLGVVLLLVVIVATVVMMPTYYR